MLILSRVCAEFRSRSGQTLFSIQPHQLLTMMDAPESIQEDPLFSLMLADGSLEAVRSVAQQEALEADPLAGINAEGKKTPRHTLRAKQETAVEMADASLNDASTSDREFAEAALELPAEATVAAPACRGRKAAK